MPNGNPNFAKEELPLLEAFFAKISPVLETFALNYNLLIEKYPHHGPEWAFVFKHPIDGKGQIEVERIDDNSILIRRCWSIDDYDTSTRFLKYPPGEKIGIDHNELGQVLENALNDVLGWQREDLVPFKAPYPWSKRCSKEQFYKQHENLPDLKCK